MSKSRIAPIRSVLRLQSYIIQRPSLSVFILAFATVSSAANDLPFFTTIPLSNDTPGQGIAWIDFDNDGDQDLFVPNGTPGEPSKFYLYNQYGGNFIDVSSGTLPGTLAQYKSRGAVVGDYNGDKYDDILVANSDGINILLKNNGDATFSDVTLAANLGNETGRTESAAFGDVNGDGWLDIYVSNYGLPSAEGDCVNRVNHLYLNNGSGTFTRRNDLGASDEGCTWTAAMTDFDDDGDLDIFVVNDVFFESSIAPASEIYRNNLIENGVVSFTAIGLDVRIAGMGIGVGDYDNDQDLDYFQTDLAKGFLSTNNGSIFATTKVEEDYPTRAGWGAAFFDADNDGNLDLYSAKSGCGFGGELRVNSFLLNNGDSTFSQHGGTDIGDTADKAMGIAVADYDSDGDTDIAIHECSGGIRLLHNDTNSGNSLRVKLVGKTDPDGKARNHRGIGARVSIVGNSTAGADAGTRNQMREIHAGSSLGSTNSSEVHFGLGGHSEVSLRVRWPNNCIQILDDIAAGSITVNEPTTCTSTIDSFSFSGSGNPGDIILIKGTNLLHADNLRFNTQPSIILGTDKVGTVAYGMVPAGASDGQILIDTLFNNDLFVGDYVAPVLSIDFWDTNPSTPLLTSVHGSNFIGVSGVLVNGAPHSTYNVNSATTITILRAGGAAEIDEVSVTTPEGTFTKSLAPSIESIADANNLYFNWTLVTGENLEFGLLNVLVNGVRPALGYNLNADGTITVTSDVNSISKLEVITDHGTDCWGAC